MLNIALTSVSYFHVIGKDELEICNVQTTITSKNSQNEARLFCISSDCRCLLS